DPSGAARMSPSSGPRGTSGPRCSGRSSERTAEPARAWPRVETQSVSPALAQETPKCEEVEERPAQTPACEGLSDGSRTQSDDRSQWSLSGLASAPTAYAAAQWSSQACSPARPPSAYPRMADSYAGRRAR